MLSHCFAGRLLSPGEIMKRGRLPSSSEDSDDNGSKSCFVVLGADQGLGQCRNTVFLMQCFQYGGPGPARQVGEHEAWRSASESDTAGL